jgi:two-component system, sensor histidine kinase
VLQRMGHHATFADNGELALKAFEDGAFDVVLMDIHMPVMDGLSVTRAIRARTDGRESTPIIALTADVLDEAREQAMSAGVNTFLTKPVQLPELRKALNAVSTALG